MSRKESNADVNMKAPTSFPARSSYKNRTQPVYRVGFHLVQLVLILVTSLPTVFFIYHLYQPSHNERAPPHATTSLHLVPIEQLNKNSSTNSTKGVQSCNKPLLFDNTTKECYPPCEWTTMSTRTHSLYYALMAIGLWLPLFSTIFVLITWSKIQSLRKFPHVIRFYIIIACICLACCKMVPLRVGLKKSFCTETKEWSPEGMRSIPITIQGASCHYFTLCLSFWSTCFILNTYLVVVRGTRKLLHSSVLIHVCQSLLCWVGPAIIVAICIYVKYPAPAYKIAFVDFMTAAPCGEVLKYLAVTLPMQVTLGTSLCFLWSVTWCIRRSRKDNTRHAIRADKDTQAMLRIERQFTVMTVMIVLVVGVMLSVTTVKDYQLERMVSLSQAYFKCLKGTSDCKQPDLKTPIYASMIILPGFLCLIFFFLLFMNKDCRKIWTSYFYCIKGTTKPRSDTNRSRCSSTLTIILGDRRLSNVIFRKDCINKLKSSSTSDLMLVARPSPLEQKRKTYLSPLALEDRPRSSSTPVRFLIPDDDDKTLDIARVTSLPHNMKQKRPYPPTPPQFKVEVKIVSNGDSYAENKQVQNSSKSQPERTNSSASRTPDTGPERRETVTEILDNSAEDACTTML